MRRTAARRACLAAVVSMLLIASGCGGSEPPPLEPMEPAAPADLCSTVPDSTKVGLVSNSNTDTTGNPTASCSLRSDTDTKSEVRAVVTWVQLDDEESAADVLASQCRSIDRTEFKEQASFTAQGADRACAARAVGAADSVTMAAVSDRDVVTVRLTEQARGQQPAFGRARQMLEGVLASMGG
jgi:hypothetical protein